MISFAPHPANFAASTGKSRPTQRLSSNRPLPRNLPASVCSPTSSVTPSCATSSSRTSASSAPTYPLTTSASIVRGSPHRRQRRRPEPDSERHPLTRPLAALIRKGCHGTEQALSRGVGSILLQQALSRFCSCPFAPLRIRTPTNPGPLIYAKVLSSLRWASRKARPLGSTSQVC